MDNFREYFSKYANEYAMSKSHRGGEDLIAMINLIDPKPDWVVADLAAGTGFTSMKVAPYVKKVVALDGTEGMLEKARELSREKGILNIEFVKAMVEKTGLPDRSFDLVTCRRAAHHFPDKKEFLSEAMRILKDNGKLVLIDMVRPENDKDDIRNRMEKLRDHSHADAPSVSRWKMLFREVGVSLDSVISTKELIKFNDFLFPVKPDSREGIECLQYLRSLPYERLIFADINPVDLSIIKERVIFLCSRKGV